MNTVSSEALAVRSTAVLCVTSDSRSPSSKPQSKVTTYGYRGSQPSGAETAGARYRHCVSPEHLRTITRPLSQISSPNSHICDGLPRFFFLSIPSVHSLGRESPRILFCTKNEILARIPATYKY